MASLATPIIATADAHPDRTALEADGEFVSYRDLSARAVHFASWLLTTSPSATCVAIDATRSAGTIAAIVGCLAAGVPYVPLNPADPTARRQIVLDAAQASHVVTNRSSLVREQSHRVVVAPPNFGNAGPTRALRKPPEPDVTDLAYTFFTSGSTGAPKGVPLTHRNAEAFAGWATNTFALSHDDRVGVLSPLFFDLSTFDIFVGLRAGATLVVVPDDVAKFPRAVYRLLGEQRVTVLYTVPSALLAILASSDAPMLPSLRLLMLAGEPFPSAHLDLLRRAVPNAELHNLYGPVEANVITSFAVPAEASAGDEIPIGTAASGATLTVLDETGDHRFDSGARGELLVSGPSVFGGYLPTGGTSPPYPFVDIDARTWYRTGDHVEISPRGELWYRGRSDSRVKVRGYLVELGEIEAVLERHPSVGSAVTCVIAPSTERASVHAFVTARPGCDVVPRDLIRWSAEQLPRFMVPARVRVVPDLPLGPTGKVDRVALTRAAQESER